MKPARQISVRITDEQYEEIKKEEIDTGKSFSEILRELLDLSLYIKKKKEEAKNDPDCFKKFLEEMNVKIDEKHIFKWIKTLSDSKLTGIIEDAKLEEKNR